MNALRNRVQLIGHIGNAPEVVNFDNDKKLCKFSVATNDTYVNNKGEKIVDTQWHQIVIWGKLAEVAEKYLDKGKEIAIEGKLVTRNYEVEGQKRYTTEIIANEFVMLGKKPNA